MNNTTQNTNKNQNELGALWKKKSKTGMSFLSGYINDHDGQRIDIVVFSNSKKTNEKAPDYRLYVSKPLENKASTPISATTKAPVEAVQKTQPVAAEVEDDIL
jgi:uncharacterized protein (DUF736 family)